MASVEELDTMPMPEEQIPPASETANVVILEHAYSSEDQDQKRVQDDDDDDDEPPETTSPSSSSVEDLVEENIVNSSETIETQIITEPIMDVKPLEPDPEPEPEPAPEPELRLEQVAEKVKSRELKSLLEAVKESNLDTNIASRRSMEPNSNKDKDKDKDHESGGKRAMRSQNPDFVAKHKKFLNKVNKFDLNADGVVQDNNSPNVKSEKDGASLPKTPKRKKENIDDDTVGGASVDDGKKSRKSVKVEPLNINMKKHKDSFCWRCHRDGILVQCESCPRGFHIRCLKQPVYNPDRWACPECLAILQAESTKTRSPAMRDMSLEHLCELLKYAAKRMINCQGSEPFIHPVDVKAFPDYQNYVVQPMDLTTLQNNIRNNVYGSTVAFLADSKWILHNSIIFNSCKHQSKLTTAAKSIVKICKQEMIEIETCSECYQNANTKKNSWFVEVCSKPHILLWAKLKGFPYWPAKGMQTNAAGLVDVRFFGAHDRAWIPVKECFLYSKKDPNTTNKNKRSNIAECIKEVDIHIQKLKQRYGEFCHAPYRTPYDPIAEAQQLSFMLPRYDPSGKIKSPIKSIKTENVDEDEKPNIKRSKSIEIKTPKRSKSRSRSRASSECRQWEKDSSRASSEVRSEFGDETETLTCSSKTSLNSEDKPKYSQEEEKFMEGYGTEDDDSILLDNEVRKSMISYDSESDEDSPLKTPDGYKNGNDDHDDDDEKSGSISETSILSRGKVRTRGGYHNVTGKVKVIGSRKRISTNSPTLMESPAKLTRRNSDMSTKSDSSRLSDKINKVEEFSDTLEVSLRNTSKDSSISSSDASSSSPEKKSRPEFISTLNKADLGKLKPVIQVNTGDLYTKNKEFRISPQSKSVSIADRLMKKITESELSSEAEKIESVKKQILDRLESSTSNENKEEDVSSSDNSEVKKPDNEEDKKNVEIAKEAEISESSSDNSDKNQSVSSSTQSTSGEEDKYIKIKEKIQEESNDTKISDSDETKEVDNNVKSSDNESNAAAEEKINISTQILKNKLNDKLESKQETRKAEEASKMEVDKESIPEKNKEESKRPINENNKEVTEKPEIEKNKEANEQQANKFISPRKSIEKQLISRRKSVDKSMISRRKSIDMPVCTDPDYTPEEQSEAESEQEECSDDDSEDEPLAKSRKIDNKLTKAVKIVNVSDILSGKTSDAPVAKPTLPPPTISKPKPTESTNIVTESIDIKSEPESEGEESDLSKKESGKPRYDVTLTMVDKQKKPKPEDIPELAKPGFKIVDNMTRIIDSVASNYSKEFEKISKQPPATNRKEITLKPISKLIMSPKQKARKSFPNSPHKMQQTFPGIKKPTLEKKETPKSTPNVSQKQPHTNTNSQTTTTSTTTTNTNVATSTSKEIVYITTQSSPALNNIGLLPPNQPISLTQNVASPILAMVHAGMSTPSLIFHQTPPLSTISQGSTTNTTSGGSVPSSDSCTTTSSLFPQPQAAEQSSQPLINDTGTLPESISKAVGDLLCKPPPRLKPRPPGPLTTYYDEGSPSSAGPTTNLINSISHRLTDYFRGLLKETLQDLASIGDPESRIRALELELETLKHKHAEEMLELRKNISSILKDIQKSIVEEKAKIVDETRAACEAERLRCVEEAKSKQWCAFCFKEAQFYCCWNTSYCDYPCQQKHWATHMKTCSQNTVRNMPPATTAATSSNSGEKTTVNAVNKPKQTYANPNKTVLKSARMIVKQTNKQGVPMYVPVQQRMGGTQQTITLVESTPGNFEIVGNHGPISLGGKLVPTTTIKMKPGNILTVASTATNNTSTTGSGAQKTIILSQKSQQMGSKTIGENKT